MANDDHSTTTCDVDKADDYDHDKEGEAFEDPSNFPEGGLRAWMTLVGRFDFVNPAITEFNRNLQLPLSVLCLWVRVRY
jgi:hypothetical protein